MKSLLGEKQKGSGDSFVMVEEAEVQEDFILIGNNPVEALKKRHATPPTASSPDLTKQPTLFLILAEAWGNGKINSDQEEKSFVEELIKKKPDLLISADGKSIIHRQIQDIEDLALSSVEKSQNNLRLRYQTTMSLGIHSLLTDTKGQTWTNKVLSGKGAPETAVMTRKG